MYVTGRNTELIQCYHTGLTLWDKIWIAAIFFAILNVGLCRYEAMKINDILEGSHEKLFGKSEGHQKITQVEKYLPTHRPALLMTAPLN